MRGTPHSPGPDGDARGNWAGHPPAGCRQTRGRRSNCSLAAADVQIALRSIGLLSHNVKAAHLPPRSRLDEGGAVRLSPVPFPRPRLSPPSTGGGSIDGHKQCRPRRLSRCPPAAPETTFPGGSLMCAGFARLLVSCEVYSETDVQPPASAWSRSCSSSRTTACRSCSAMSSASW